jgi:hypothetical protein
MDGWPTPHDGTDCTKAVAKQFFNHPGTRRDMREATQQREREILERLRQFCAYGWDEAGFAWLVMVEQPGHHLPELAGFHAAKAKGYDDCITYIGHIRSAVADAMLATRALLWHELLHECVFSYT